MSHSRLDRFAPALALALALAACNDAAPAADGRPGRRDAGGPCERGPCAAADAATARDGAAADRGAGDGSRCGDGVRDPGEACDGEACCTAQCTLAAAGAICRPAADPCDAAEVCDGVAAGCPADARRAQGAAPLLLPDEVPLRAGGTHPRVLARGGATMVAALEASDAADKLLVTAVSQDHGASWAALGEIARHPNVAGEDLANPYPFALPGGELLVAFRHHNVVAGQTVYRLLVSASGDGGAQWAFRGEIEVLGGGPGIWEPLLFRAPQGQLQAYYAKEKANGEQSIVMRWSSDGGAHWAGPRTVASQNGSRDGMPGVAALADGTIVVAFESWRQPGDPHFAIRTVQSSDGGASFAQRQLAYAPSSASRNAGAPQLAALADGRLALIFMTDEGASSPAWPQRAAVKVLLSAPAPTGGQLAWAGPPLEVAAASAYWPGLAPTATGDLLALFDRGGPKARRICLGR